MVATGFPEDALAAVEGFLVGIHILVRPAEEGQVVGVRMRIEHREALGNRQLRLRMDKPPVHPQDGFLQLRTQAGHLLPVCTFHDGDELVPADPEDVFPAENLREDIGRLDDDPVAGFMPAAGLAALYRLNLEQTEYAAEIAMEHHLGLTCDPVNGLVQIPCIERNAVAAMRAISAVNLSRFLYETRKISFDTVIGTMYQTGKDMDEKYRETSHGGLAQLYKT